MKYYSTKLDRLFETVEDLQKAEKAYDDKQHELEEIKTARSEAAKKVEAAYKLAEDAKKNADTLLAEFCKKYGAYHTTITKPATTSTLFDLLDHFPFWF